jgi:hypothetical protein
MEGLLEISNKRFPNLLKISYLAKEKKTQTIKAL